MSNNSEYSTRSGGDSPWTIVYYSLDSGFVTMVPASGEGGAMYSRPTIATSSRPPLDGTADKTNTAKLSSTSESVNGDKSYAQVEAEEDVEEAHSTMNDDVGEKDGEDKTNNVDCKQESVGGVRFVETPTIIEPKIEKKKEYQESIMEPQFELFIDPRIIDHAVLFSEKLHSLHDKINTKFGARNPSLGNIKLVIDLSMAVKFFTVRDEIKSSAKFYRQLLQQEHNCDNWRVQLGYHYTSSKNMDTIRQRGLLTKKERENLGIYSEFHGASYGDGVYITATPFDAKWALDDSSDTGIFVAYVTGNNKNDIDNFNEKDNWDIYREDVTDSVETKSLIALKRSCQVLPLFEFPESYTNPNNSNDNNNNQEDLIPGAAEAMKIVTFHLQCLLDDLNKEIGCSKV